MFRFISFLFISLVIPGLIFARPPKIAPSEIDANIVTNTSFGFHGIRYRLPAGYIPYKPLPRSTPSHDNAQWAWSMSTDYSKSRGRNNAENLAFSRTERGITVALVRVVGGIPTRPSDFDYKQWVNNDVAKFKFSSGNVVVRDARAVGDCYVGCVVRELPEYGRCNAVYLMPIAPGGLLVINAVAPLSDRAGIMADAESLVASLVLLKPSP